MNLVLTFLRNYWLNNYKKITYCDGCGLCHARAEPAAKPIKTWLIGLKTYIVVEAANINKVRFSPRLISAQLVELNGDQERIWVEARC